MGAIALGRMTKFLHQTASVENHLVNADGSSKLDVYGQPMYAEAMQVKCRKEVHRTRASTGSGQFVNLSTVYYFDENVKVSAGDRIDGQYIQSIEEYVDGAGTLVGYRVDV